MPRTMLFLCIAIGLSAGILSCTFFLWTWLVGTPAAGGLWLELVALAALAAVLFRSRFKSEPPSSGGRYRAASVVFLVVSLFVAGLFIVRVRDSPRGGWDAWAIWNLHARFLYRGGERWTDMFTAPFFWAHLDYPLLVPSLVASGWTLVGSDTTAIPSFVAFIFTFGTLALLVTSVFCLANGGRGIAAGLILLATPDFFLQGTYQMADVPLAFYILLTIVLFYLSDKFENDGLLLALAGLSAGFAAWTKNEGLLFLVVITVRFLAGIHKPLRIIWREIGMFCCGLAPVLWIVVAFKSLLSPPNDIVSGTGLFAAHLKDPERYAQIGAYFVHGIAVFGGAIVNPLIAVAAYLIYIRLSSADSHTVRKQLGTISVLALMLTGYFFVYVVTPNDLDWHLDTSFQRLLLHLWPTLVFCVACSGLGLEGRAVVADAPVTVWKGRVLNFAVGFVAFAAISPSIGLLKRTPAPPLETKPSAQSVVRMSVGEEPVSIVTSSPAQTVQSGYARFDRDESDASVSGLSFLDYRPHDLESEVTVVASAPISAGVLPFRFGEGYKTSIAITNPNSASADVTFSVESNHDEHVEIPANGQVTAYLDEPPFNARNREGTFVFHSSIGVAVLSLLTFQGKGTPFLMANVRVASAAAARTQSVHIPYVARGAGWSTELMLVNPTPVVLSGHHRWYRAAGDLTDSAPYSIPPHATVICQAASAPSGFEAGRIEIVANRNMPAPYETAVLAATSGAQARMVTVSDTKSAMDSTLYVEWSHSADTDIEIANPSRHAVTARVGLVSAAKDFVVPPGGVLTVPLVSLPHFDKPDQAMVHVTAASPLAVAALRSLTDGFGHRRLITTYSADLPGGSIFPHFAIGGLFDTEFVLFGPNPTPASGLLKFIRPTGQPMEVLVSRVENKK